MWTCPKCQRQFKNKNQDHSCGDYSVESLFSKYPEIFPLFEKIRNLVLSFGRVELVPVKNAVMFRVQTNFLVAKPHRSYLVLEFSSKHRHDEFPVEKCVKISKTRFAHILKIDSPENIDKQLTGWLREAYLSDTE